MNISNTITLPSGVYKLNIDPSEKASQINPRLIAEEMEKIEQSICDAKDEVKEKELTPDEKLCLLLEEERNGMMNEIKETVVTEDPVVIDDFSVPRLKFSKPQEENEIKDVEAEEIPNDISLKVKEEVKSIPVNIVIPNETNDKHKERILRDCRMVGFSEAFTNANSSIYNDNAFIIRAIEESYMTNPEILRTLPERFQNNKEIVMAAVKKNGSELQYASDDLKDDINIVREAVLQDSGAIFYASNRIRNNKLLLKSQEQVDKITDEVNKKYEEDAKPKKKRLFFKKRP